MLCPRCGRFIDSAAVNYCPNCGYELGSYSVPILVQRNFSEWVPAPVPQKQVPRGSRRNKALALCLVFAIISGAVICIFQASDDDQPYGKVEIQTATDDTYFELSGDFLVEMNILSVNLADNGRIAFTLSDSVSSKYDYYVWTLFDRDHVSSTSAYAYSEYRGNTVSKAEPVLYLLSQAIGEYDISVKCYVESNGQRTYAATYSGTVGYIGTITKEYTWIYQNTEYTAQTAFGYDYYRYYKNLNTNGRSVTNYGDTVSFVIYDDPVIGSLAESLSSAYGNADRNGQAFAQYIVSFVQICFGYPPFSSYMGADKYQYGLSEYFAYPVETIFFGMGDCEDTSILLSALFKALGFDTAVVIIPGHAVSAVSLEQYSPGNYSTSSYEVLSQNIGGETYYACETTVNRSLGIGLVSLAGYEGSPYSDYIGTEKYGFYVV
ncbi:MAG: hypothetical protein LBJ20_02365 [Candidatus Methanoplasma sp.]|nr:hypothetical protein [Candidatus Methanoplasma sp.]